MTLRFAMHSVLRLLPTLLLPVMIAPATVRAELIHQYSFTDGATDLIGSADATLHGGASVISGQLVLDGVDDYA